MAKFWLCAAVGFYALLQVCEARMDLNISCRYAGVFHVEKNQRYSLTREEAVQLCEALNSTIPTWEQMEKAYTLGFETCRYGYIEDKIVLPRHTPYNLCAANNTGIYILSSNISDRYDTYCFNSSESRDVVCDPVKKLYSDLPNNNSSIEIFNADGSRYFEGKKVTERPQVTEDDSSVGSGSAFGRGTTDPSDFTPEDDITPFTPEYGRDDHHHQHPGNPEDQNPNQSFEDDDDGGGDDDEEGSGQKNPETVLEWDNSGDKELQTSNTTVNSSKDVKQEESAHNILLPAVHSGRDSEVRYSTNDTNADVLTGIVEKYSTTTAVSSSDDFFKQEDSKQPQLEGASPELEIEDTVTPAINTSDVLHPEFFPSEEKESTLEKESFHHPVTFSNGSIEHEEEHQHQPSAVDTVTQRSQISVANRTIHDILQVLVSSRDSYYENASSQSAVVSSVSTDSEVPTRDSLLHLKNSEEKYHTNTSREQLLPGILPTTANVGFYGTKEDPTSEPVRQWVSEDKYTTKATVDVLFPGIVPRRGINQKNKTDHTVVASSDGDKNEKSDLGPEWLPTWTSDDEKLINNSQDPINRHPPSTDSPDPNQHSSVVRDKNVTPLPGESGKSQPRMAHIPDWLIVVASLLALALILGVCIAVNSRRRCGQKKKLVINNGKGGIDEKKKDGLNGDASKSQEMVHLVHKEKPENQKGSHDEFQAIDETQNQQDVPLKSGM
ncbi:CD44 antigen isoform X10 [Ahaetulla prasina]|uniref:CD44 antigen isoform X10 n=1 Tax=Ahaetulla prasina TaxID=499056 RepID=UPI0026472854|nr:CD44 antigen isoform X10 [Ahaetulla prasina]